MLFSYRHLPFISRLRPWKKNSPTQSHFTKKHFKSKERFKDNIYQPTAIWIFYHARMVLPLLLTEQTNWSNVEQMSSLWIIFSIRPNQTSPLFTCLYLHTRYSLKANYCSRCFLLGFGNKRKNLEMYFSLRGSLETCNEIAQKLELSTFSSIG